MFKFIRKPEPVEAVQHFADMGTRTAVIPQWLIEACRIGTVRAICGDTYVKLCDNIWQQIHDGEWIVRNTDGEFEVLSDDDFNLLFEPATKQSLCQKQ